MSEYLAKSLLTKYRALYDAPPAWAYSLPPSIPFIGKSYQDARPKIAVYGSAENLVGYEKSPDKVPPYLKDERVQNRHRAALDENRPGFFPFVHIGPVNDGGLLCAALFVQSRLATENLQKATNPLNFIETLSVSNVGKFSIAVGAEGNNQDYAGNSAYVEASMPYLRADMEVLQPDVLLLPRKMYKVDAVRTILKGVLPEAKVLPATQFTPTTINVQLKKYQHRAEELQAELAGTRLDEWTSNIGEYKTEYIYRYYAELETLL